MTGALRQGAQAGLRLEHVGGAVAAAGGDDAAHGFEHLGFMSVEEGPQGGVALGHQRAVIEQGRGFGEGAVSTSTASPPSARSRPIASAKAACARPSPKNPGARGTPETQPPRKGLARQGQRPGERVLRVEGHGGLQHACRQAHGAKYKTRCKRCASDGSSPR